MRSRVMTRSMPSIRPDSIAGSSRSPVRLTGGGNCHAAAKDTGHFVASHKVEIGIGLGVLAAATGVGAVIEAAGVAGAVAAGATVAEASSGALAYGATAAATGFAAGRIG